MRSRFALDTRLATIFLTMALAMASFPLTSGWVIVDSQCAFTMDICHPAQALEITGTVLFAPAPPILALGRGTPQALRTIRDSYVAIIGRLGEAPEVPPPKFLLA